MDCCSCRNVDRLQRMLFVYYSSTSRTITTTVNFDRGYRNDKMYWVQFLKLYRDTSPVSFVMSSTDSVSALFFYAA